MLSRVADSIFWMNRYIERAENVARFIDVNWHLMLDSDGSAADDQWLALVNTTGDHAEFAKHYDKVTRDNVIKFLSFDENNGNSILRCVRAARENARTVRDVISSEMWEQINTFHLMVREASASGKALESPHEFFNQVKNASHLFLGITDTTMSHGEGWNFARLGQMIERCDKTSRILDVKYNMLNARNTADADAIQWAAILKSASALEMYRKTHRRITPERVVEFLMFDFEFPRAVLFCLAAADHALHSITHTPQGQAKMPAEQLMSELYRDLTTTTVSDVLASGLHQYVDALQTRLNQVGIAIDNDFFSSEETLPVKKSTQILTQTQTQGASVQTQKQG